MVRQPQPLEVRRYRPADRAAVLTIAADTAFFGEPVEALLDDRRLFLDLMYRGYLDHQARYLWVAAILPGEPGEPGEVVGFLAGCPDTRAFRRRWQRAVLPRLLARLLAGRYRLGRRTVRYAADRLLAGWRDPRLRADLGGFPAHLHVNVVAAARGRGAGRRLVDAGLGQLRDLGVPGVHLVTTDANRAACRLYESLGFEVLAAAPATGWRRTLGRAVETRVYGLELDAAR